MSSAMAAAAAGGPAGFAMAEIVETVKSAITGILDTLKAGFTKMKSLIEDTVAAFRPAELELFTRAVNDLRAAVGTILLPVLQSMTQIVRQLADYIYSLPDSFKGLIRAFAEIALVAGLATIVVGGIAAALGALLLINPAIVLLTAYVAAIGALTYVFSQTESGARFFAKALTFLEQVLAGIEATAQYVWQQVQPVWQELQVAFSELGDSLSELLEALKPLVAGGLAVIGAAIKWWLEGMIAELTLFVKALNYVVKGISSLLGPLSGFGLSLPSVEREQKSARGLGVHGGNVTDLLGSFRQIQESILNFASDAEAKKNEEEQRQAIKSTATNTGRMVQIWEAALPGFLGGLGVVPAPFRAGRP